MGTVPGYWFTVALVDTMGRVTIQYMGARLYGIADRPQAAYR